MKKLYKRIDGSWHYQEAWKDGAELVFHAGEVGTRGRTETCAKRRSRAVEIDSVLENARAEGYREVPLDEHALLRVTYQCEGWGGPEDLDKRHRIEDLLNEELGWTGLGHCDGGEIGSGSIDIFSYVIDADVASRIVYQCLESNGLQEGAVVSALLPGSDVFTPLEKGTYDLSKAQRDSGRRPWWRFW